MAHANPIQVQKFLSGMDYPATKDEIVKHAKSRGADDNILDTLERLPDDDNFETPADVSKAIGKIE
jgi:trehalose-6-phosphatase